MSIRIFCPDESEPCPKRVWMELTCDGAHGLLEPPRLLLRDDTYGEQRHAATVAGWRFSDHGKHFGPCCPRAKA